MPKSTLDIDWGQVSACRSAASAIAESMDTFIRGRTTVAVERTVARLFGVDGVDDADVPLPNVVVDQIAAAGSLDRGVAGPLVAAMIHSGRDAQQVAEALACRELDLTRLPEADPGQVLALGAELGASAADRIAAAAAERSARMAGKVVPEDPLLYVIVATGNIFEDAVQGQSAGVQGADVVAVIRSTGQSLLDYVPFGTTTEGYGGTFATQANFRVMRQALDDAAEGSGRYHMLCNYCSGLCMPEIAAMGALERLDMMLNDALYGILFRDINPQRTLIDQYFSRMINALAGVIINTGEDNYLTTDDAVEATHTVLASQFMNEQFALRSGLPPAQMGLGHAMEMDPEIKNGFLMELAQAQLVRDIFGEHRLKYMPPTRHMTGDTMKGLIQDALFNLIGAWTKQGIQLLGMQGGMSCTSSVSYGRSFTVSSTMT